MFITIKLSSIKLIFVLFITAVMIFGSIAGIVVANKITPMEFTVVLDAGHGGIDLGAKGKSLGVFESGINLAICKKLKAELVTAGYNVVLTREDENGLYQPQDKNKKQADMKKRLQIMKAAKPDLLISIHLNSCQYAYRRGAQVFFYDERGNILAKVLQKGLNEDINQPILQKELLCLFGNYFILSNAPCPAVIVECGFLSNEQDEQLLCQDAHQERLAVCIARQVSNYCLV